MVSCASVHGRATLRSIVPFRTARSARCLPLSFATSRARDFFRGAMATALAPDELLAETRLAILPADTRFGFEEFSRRAGDYALAMALVVLRVEAGIIAAPRIGLGGAEAAPRRIEAAEAALSGQPPGEAVFREAAAAAAAAIDPIEDVQSNAQYRRELIGAMVYRALTRACMPDRRSRA
jgi:carbon-monoxide dehydrogenase medium subunit